MGVPEVLQTRRISAHSRPGITFSPLPTIPGGWQAYIQLETDAMKLPYLILALLLLAIAVVFVFSKLPKIGDEGAEPASGKKEKLIDFDVLKRSHLRWGVIAQFFYNGGQTAINSLFLVYCCTYAGLPEDTATTFFGLYMLAFLLGRWIGTGLMVKFRPQDMLLVYALMNILLCGVVMLWGGMIGLYAMLAISFFMSIMYPTQFSLALKGLGNQTKSGSAFLVMAIVGNACLPQLTAYFIHSHYISHRTADSFNHDISSKPCGDFLYPLMYILCFRVYCVRRSHSFGQYQFFIIQIDRNHRRSSQGSTYNSANPNHTTANHHHILIIDDLSTGNSMKSYTHRLNQSTVTG
jgi:hypothetical protein